MTSWTIILMKTIKNSNFKQNVSFSYETNPNLFIQEHGVLKHSHQKDKKSWNKILALKGLCRQWTTHEWRQVLIRQFFVIRKSSQNDKVGKGQISEIKMSLEDKSPCA